MMNRRNFYSLWIEDLNQAKGPVPELAFDGLGPNHLAAAVQEALRYPGLFERWRRMHDAPEHVDMDLSQIDDHAEVKVRSHELGAELDIVTLLPMRVVRERLNMLIGSHWVLRDIRAA